MFEASSAVTVKLKAVPAVALAGAVTEKCVGGAALTLMEPEVPAVKTPAASATVRVWLPLVLKVTENVPLPFVNFESAGSAA